MAILLYITLFAQPAAAPPPPYAPKAPAHYVECQLGVVHGAQYWVNPGATPESIDEDFRRMSQEDGINAARLAFWTIPTGTEPDFLLWDACFAAADKYGVALNPVLPYYPDWVGGGADSPENQKAQREHIHKLVSRYVDEPALALWTVDIEPSRSWKMDPSEDTLALYRSWLRKRYPSEKAFCTANPGMASFNDAYPVNKLDKGPWNNYRPLNDWLTFINWALAEQTRRMVEYVREIDTRHAVSCTPPNTLHNQWIENGRDMYWLADMVDVPSSQMHAHWHLEIADMPEDVLAAQAASIRKVVCSARDRRPTYSGEVMAGPDLGESPRLYTPLPDELVATSVLHFAEGSKGYFYWIWNPLMHGPIAGAWGLRNPDGSPTDRVKALRPIGAMVSRHGNVLAEARPEQARVAILDSRNAAIYLYRRSQHHPMARWYCMNQYGLFKALRREQIPCDFVDEADVTGNAVDRYDVLYVPFSMAMTEELGMALRNYVAQGGTIICDAATAFTGIDAIPFQEQPGVGLHEVLGLRPGSLEVVGSGWTEVAKQVEESAFYRYQTRDPDTTVTPLFDEDGAPTGLVARKFLQTVEPTDGLTVLAYDDQQRPVVTEHVFGKGKGVWTGTLLGLTCREADTPSDRYEGVANLFRRYIPNPSWRLDAKEDGIICRRLTAESGDLFILINEGGGRASFRLETDLACRAQELLWPDAVPWRQTGKQTIKGELEPFGTAVIHCTTAQD